VGSPAEWVQQAAAVLEPVEAHIRAALSQAPVQHHDETGVRQAGRLAWVYVASTK
jgi:Transposase IS66 family